MGKEANSNIDRKSLYLDGMMGLVVGDALGVPVEFSSREEREQDPVKEMRGYGHTRLLKAHGLMTAAWLWHHLRHCRIIL